MEKMSFYVPKLKSPDKPCFHSWAAEAGFSSHLNFPKSKSEAVDRQLKIHTALKALPQTPRPKPCHFS